jgi:hypothetical protein
MLARIAFARLPESSATCLNIGRNSAEGNRKFIEAFDLSDRQDQGGEQEADLLALHQSGRQLDLAIGVPGLYSVEPQSIICLAAIGPILALHLVVENPLPVDRGHLEFNLFGRHARRIHAADN